MGSSCKGLFTIMDGHTVQITIGSYTAIVDGEPVEMDKELNVFQPLSSLNITKKYEKYFNICNKSPHFCVSIYRRQIIK